MSQRKKSRPKFLALVAAEVEARAQFEAEQSEQAAQGAKKENPQDVR